MIGMIKVVAFEIRALDGYDINDDKHMSLKEVT